MKCGSVVQNFFSSKLPAILWIKLRSVDLLGRQHAHVLTGMIQSEDANLQVAEVMYRNLLLGKKAGLAHATGPEHPNPKYVRVFPIF